MKKWPVVLILSLFCISLFSQNYVIDSLKKELFYSKTEKQKITIYNLIAKELLNKKDTNFSYYADLAIQTSKKNNLDDLLCQSYINKAKYYYNLVQFDKTLINYFTALEIAEKNNLDSLAFNCLSSIGITYSFINEGKKSYNYLLKAEKVGHELNYTHELFGVYNNLALYYEDFNLKKSKQYFFKILNSSDYLNSENYITTLMNLSYVYNLENKTDSSFIILKKALRASINIQDTISIGWCYGFYSHIFYNMQEYDSALYYVNNAMNYLIECSDYQAKLNDLSLGYELLYKIYSAKNNFEPALINYLKYISIKDTLINIEKNKQISEIETKYEVSRKITENKLLKQKNKTGRLILMAVLAITFLLIVLAIILLKARKMQKWHNNLLHLKNTQLNEQNEKISYQKEEITKQNKKITIQKNKLAEQNRQITDSINYASKIQTAVLPLHEKMNKIIPEHFVIFKPKDIVSGDFYWVRKINKYIIIAVADCTGHGVSGALLSMLGFAFLNEIITKKDILDTNQVLEELRKEVKLALQQVPENYFKLNDIEKYLESDIRDGMDIALCVIDTELNTLDYSGANSPAYLVQKKEIIELEPTENPIGIYFREIPFENKHIKLKGDEILYLFSDGYIDQFGGKNGTKFYSNRFKKLLVDIHEEPMQKQKEILENTFEDWKGNSNQIDDVLVMGIKI